MNKKIYSHNKIKIIFMFLTLVFIESCTNKTNFEKIITSDKDEIYETIKSYSNKMDSAEFEKLVIKLLDKSNIDMLSNQQIFRFAYENEKCDYIPYLESKANYLGNIPEDSTWLTKLNSNYYRENRVDKNSCAIAEINKYLLKLKNECVN